MNFYVHTLGCRVNLSESESLIDTLRTYGLNESPLEQAEIAIINTCTVTSRADSKSLRMIKQMTQGPFSRKVFVTGCYSELQKDLRQKVPKITAIIPHTQKARSGEIILKYLKKQCNGPEKHLVNKASLKLNGDPDKFMGYRGRLHKVAFDSMNNHQARFYHHTRALIKIQDGCNRFCSFCRIPYARGVPVSRDIDDILSQVKKVINKGVPEIVITGVNIGDYHFKKNQVSYSLATVLKEILKISSACQIRLSTVEPQAITDEVICLLSHRNIAPHIHFALQAGSNDILKAMNRQYSTEEFLEKINKIYQQRPDFAISTDIIAGFPGETDEIFKRSLDFIKSCQFMKMHVFPFSPRPLTKAEKILQTVTPEQKKARVKTLIKLGHLGQKKFLKKVQQAKQVLIAEEIDKQANHLIVKGTTGHYLKGVLSIPLKELNIKNEKAYQAQQGDKFQVRLKEPYANKKSQYKNEKEIWEMELAY